MEITKEKINKIHKSLESGQKKLLADKLGIHQSALSRYLNLQVKLNKRTGKIEKGYFMPSKVYQQIINYINQ